MIYVTHDQIEAMSMADLIAVMDAGSLQQFGTPYEVYNCPVNTFVANFIGNPNMNLIDCSFQVENGSAYLVLNGCSDSITLNGASKMLIENFRNSEQLILGIRPEHLHIYDGPVKPGLLPVSVHFVEPLGPKTVVHLRLGEQDVVRAIAPASFKSRIAEQRWIELDQDYLHIFDKKTSLAIL
jgi:multiple sugar transport system ATP-binding protein